MSEPNWIKNEAEHDKQAKDASDAHDQEMIDNSFKIAREGPAFWKQLLVDLADNTNALPKIALEGHAYPIQAPAKGEQLTRVEVKQPGAVFPNSTHTDLFYNLGSGAIRAVTGEQKTGIFGFHVSHGELAVVQEGGDSRRMNSPQMAEFIVKRMATMVRKAMRQGA